MLKEILENNNEYKSIGIVINMQYDVTIVQYYVQVSYKDTI